MTDWSEYFKSERERLMALLRGTDDTDDEMMSLMKKREPTFNHENLADWASRHQKIDRAWMHAHSYPLFVPGPAKRRQFTRAEIIRAVWAEAEDQYPEKAGPDGLLVYDPHFGKFDFEPKRYGDEIVIECEGVVVRRDPMIDIEIK